MNIYLTQRALNDLQNIFNYSEKEFGSKVAVNYMGFINTALELIQSNPEILLQKPLISDQFKVYNVQKHWLVFDQIGNELYLLTVQHVSIEMLKRLKELSPNLESEIEFLRLKIKKNSKLD